MKSPRRRAALLLAGTLILLTAIYLSTLMTQVTGGVETNGQQDPYLLDVGELQVSLNVWGTIHFTGYPLFTMLGNLTTLALRSAGVNPAAAASLFSTGCILVALAVFYLVVYHLTGQPEIAAATTLLLGLARSVWTHAAIANVRGMSFAFEAVLLTVALWSAITTAEQGRWRIWLLALIGGFGVAHHRSVSFMAPGLLLAVWPGLRLLGRRAWITVAIAVPIALIGFLPYLYLPARALAHADWVYGHPDTPAGFWQEFTGSEVTFLMHTPVDAQAWVHDITDTFTILLTDLTPLFAIAGGIALVWAMIASRFRREARIAFVCALGYLLDLFAFHYVVIPQAIAMPIVLALVLALAFALDGLIAWLKRPRINYALPAIFAIIALIVLLPAQYRFVYSLTHNDTGLAMIDLAKRVPRDNSSIMMMPWGPRFTAIAYSKYVTKENADLTLVQHTADLASMAAPNTVFYTGKDTFYLFPLSWWDARLGRAYLSSPSDGLVAIRRAPLTETPSTQPLIEVGHGVAIRSAMLCTAADAWRLTITWQAEAKPDADLSVFVKLLQGNSVIAQADSSAPVYGQYPTSRWSAGEDVIDTYTLPHLPQANAVTFGMYQQEPSGEFKNYGTQVLPLQSIPACTDNPN